MTCYVQPKVEHLCKSQRKHRGTWYVPPGFSFSAYCSRSSLRCNCTRAWRLDEQTKALNSVNRNPGIPWINIRNSERAQQPAPSTERVECRRLDGTCKHGNHNFSEFSRNFTNCWEADAVQQLHSISFFYELLPLCHRKFIIGCVSVRLNALSAKPPKYVICATLKHPPSNAFPKQINKMWKKDLPFAWRATRTMMSSWWSQLSRYRVHNQCINVVKMFHSKGK